MHSFSVSVVKFGKRVKDWLLREGTVQWKRMWAHFRMSAFVRSLGCIYVFCKVSARSSLPSSV